MSREDYPNITEVVHYDITLGNANAQFLPELREAEFDFIHSSHCLEHLVHPRVALMNWLRVLKPGGYIICTVPEELLYEEAVWPSRHNPDHKHSFTLRSQPLIPWSINLLQFLAAIPEDIEHVSFMTEGWSHERLGSDQTLGPAECAIEFVARKPDPSRPW